MAIDGIGLAAVGTGVMFVYAGFTGKSVLQSIQAMITGQSPFKLANAHAIHGGTGNPSASVAGSTGVSGTVDGAAIANDALQYVGHKYVYGGAPGPAGTNGWDCSSFVSWVLGHDFKMTLPGGVSGYAGADHGPVASSYMSMGTRIPRASVSAGDLIVWSTHIGIALNNTQMVSALNESLGTQVTGIENGGPQGESLVCQRISMG